MRLKVEQAIVSLERADSLLHATDHLERTLLDAIEGTIDKNRTRYGQAFCKH